MTFPEKNQRKSDDCRGLPIATCACATRSWLDLLRIGECSGYLSEWSETETLSSFSSRLHNTDIAFW